MKGIFIGRMCPIHLGHEEIIKKMIRECLRSIASIPALSEIIISKLWF